MKILSFIKNKKPSTATQKGTGVSPKRDWYIILVVFVCLNVAALGFHAFLFYRISRGGFFSVPEVAPSTASSVNEEKMDEVLDHFREKERRLLRKIANPDKVQSVR